MSFGKRIAVFSLLGVFTSLFFASIALCDIEEQVNVRLLEIWVKATDKKDHPVMDLNPQDFTVYIDGKAADMRCFDKTVTTPAEEQASTENEELGPPPKEPKRRFILFFDLLNTPMSDIAFLKPAVEKFLNTSFQSQDQGMIFVLLPNMRLGIVKEPTFDKTALIDVVDRMQGNPNLEVNFRNNQKMLLDLLRSASLPTSAGRGTGGLFAAQQIRQAQDLTRRFAREEELMGRVALGSFTSIADYLSNNTVGGRQVLIYASSGFPMQPGLSYFNLLNQTVENAQLQGTEDMVFRDMPTLDFSSDIKKTVGVLNRMNVTIYSVDAEGLIEPGKGAEYDGSVMGGTATALSKGIDSQFHHKNYQDSLVFLASETGGLSFINSQNFPRGLTTIVSDISQQYWLCAKAPDPEKRGKYHQIKVSVNRAGLNLRYRKGYVD